HARKCQRRLAQGAGEPQDPAGDRGRVPVGRCAAMSAAPGFCAEVGITASPGRVYEALTTLDGLAGWWTPMVTGDPHAGGQVGFGFGNQRIVMRGTEATCPTRVRWACLEHSKFPEWDGTNLRFDLRPDDQGGGVVTFEHAGLLTS